ncbi:PerC family transcriptional regulator [Klebsiella oxytoca]|uniref:PerC family transcriptional regulator n=1 Tax=Klebsiella oxytoca TaxID=571 RepID=UPI0038507F08
MSGVVNDMLARKLEAAGLWRRAADRWLEVMLSYGLSDTQREWVRRRRKRCLSETEPVVVEERLNVMEILNAAKAAQKRMGLSQSGGAAFRYKDQKSIKKAVNTDSFQTEETDAELLIREYFWQQNETDLK